MSQIPKHLQYTEDHEWVMIEEDIATVGITDYAQEALGDLVYVELPEIGTKVEAEDDFVVVESVKAASEVYAPISGEVIEVNEALNDTPELINNSPYEDGWIAKIRISNHKELENLMGHSAYKQHVE